jgi:methylmalonyl-CoA mutase N-terminal domain/subunit
LIWYKDQILKNFSLEALTIEMQDLKKRVRESEERRAREIASRNYPLIGFSRPAEKKAEDPSPPGDDVSSENIQATEPEGGKDRLRHQLTLLTL